MQPNYPKIPSKRPRLKDRRSLVQLSVRNGIPIHHPPPENSESFKLITFGNTRPDARQYKSDDRAGYPIRTCVRKP